MMKRLRIGGGSERLGSSEESLSPSLSKLNALFHRSRNENPNFAFRKKSVVFFVVSLIIYRCNDYARATVDTSEGFLTSGDASPASTGGSSRVSAQQVLSLPIDLKKCTVHQLAPELVQWPNTVVTAYFRVKSKYNPEKYDNWMSNMLSIQDPVIVFTQSDMIDKVKQLRQHALNRTVIIESKYEDLPVSRLGDDEFWQNQLDIDPEKHIHRTFQLFWIWLSKSWWTVQAIQLNYFQSNFFLWSDIGCFRKRAYNNKLIIQYPDIVPAGTILWMAHHAPNPPPTTPFWVDKLKRGERQHFYHSGSQGAGAARSWVDFHGKFAITLDQFLQKDLFAGEDQCVLQATCLLYPKMCAYAPFDQVSDNFYFGLRYLLHHGPNSAKNTPNRRYRFWRPPGWDS